MFPRRGGGTTGERTPASEALRLLDTQGFGPVLVLNPAGVVMGAAYRDHLESAPAEAEVGTVMRFGVSTVRPSEDAAALTHPRAHPGATRAVEPPSDSPLVCTSSP